jgi:hypothetical protein
LKITMTLDWQTVVVTIVALAAALVVVRRFVPARRRSTARPGAPAAPVACEHCETGARATRSAAAATAGSGSGTRTQTTPVVSVRDLRASSKARRPS